MSQLELKIPPLALFFLFGLLMYLAGWLTPDHAFDPLFRNSLAVLLLAASAVFGIGALLHFRTAGTTVNPLEPERSSALVTSGVFRLSRNPMYLALLLALVAWGLFLSNLYALALATLFVPYMNRFQIGPEERAMESGFGDAFTAYCRSTRRWI